MNQRQSLFHWLTVPRHVAAFIVVVATMAAGRSTTAAVSLIRYEQTQVLMGTEFRVVFYSADQALAMKSFQEVFQRIRELDAKLSDYSDTSELTLLSQSAHEAPRRVSDDLWKVLSSAQKVSTATKGAFDITVGPAVRLWRRARRTHVLPSPERIAGITDRIGFQHLSLEAGRREVTLKRDGMLLDLGGIAKGFATSESLDILKEKGICHAMVAGGGDIAVSGAPPGDQGWRIARNRPGETSSVPNEYLVLTNRFVSTSGDASQFVELGGKRYSHVIDPRTGWALSRRRQATVVGCDGMIVDALASALCVLGPEGARETLAHFPGVECRIDEFGEAMATWTTEGWSSLIESPAPQP